MWPERSGQLWLHSRSVFQRLPLSMGTCWRGCLCPAQAGTQETSPEGAATATDQLCPRPHSLGNTLIRQGSWEKADLKQGWAAQTLLRPCKAGRVEGGVPSAQPACFHIAPYSSSTQGLGHG